MKFWIILLGSLGILGVLGFVFLANTHHSGEGLTAAQKQKALTNLLGRAPVTTPQDHTTFIPYTSPAVRFLYPSWATVNVSDNEAAKKDPLTIDSFHFTLSDEHLTGTISVTRRGNISQIADDPGVRLRLNDLSYTKIGADSAGTMQFLNTNTAERSLFIFNNNIVFALVISGGVDSDNEAVFGRIKESLKF